MPFFNENLVVKQEKSIKLHPRSLLSHFLQIVIIHFFFFFFHSFFFIFSFFSAVMRLIFSLIVFQILESFILISHSYIVLVCFCYSPPIQFANSVLIFFLFSVFIIHKLRNAHFLWRNIFLAVFVTVIWEIKLCA